MTRMVLLTRPQPVDDGVADALQKVGVHYLHLPTLRVAAQVDEAFESSIRHVGVDCDGVVLVSQHAVAFAAERLQELKCIWPAHAWMAAVGHASGQAIAKNWPQARLITPALGSAEDSDGLWQALDEAGLIRPKNKVLIVRAQTGRDVLRQRLIDAGVQVDVWSCYHRAPQQWRDSERQQVTAQLQSHGLVLSITSIEGLISLCDNCVALLDDLRHQPLVTLHSAIAMAAKQLGFLNVICVAPHQMAETLLAQCR